MPYTTNHFKLTLSGTLGSPVAEIWQTQLRLAGASPVGVSDTARTTFLNSVATAAAAVMANASFGMSTATVLTQLKIASIGTDGHYYPATEMPTIKTVSSAGTGASTHALTSCLTWSLRTRFPRGRAAYGKMFWPALQLTIGSDGLVSAALRDNCLTAAKTFLDAVNTAANTMAAGLRICVMSNLGEGITEPVTKVGMGREPDYLSRRRSKTVESTTFSALA